MDKKYIQVQEYLLPTPDFTQKSMLFNYKEKFLSIGESIINKIKRGRRI